jgi:hypothetical protein
MACIPTINEKVRAEVWMGDTLIAKTPFVKSFSIQEARSQMYTTLSLTVEVMGGIPFPLGENLTVKAGLRGNLITRFTGEIGKTTVKPSFGKPSYYTMIIEGQGVLSALDGKTFTRRIPPNSEGTYCLITGGAKNSVDKFKTLDKKVQSGNHQMTSTSPNPSRNYGENSPLVVHKKNTLGNSSKGGLVGALASPPTNSDPDATGGLGVHDHSDLDNGGPAFGVFSSE